MTLGIWTWCILMFSLSIFALITNSISVPYVVMMAKNNKSDIRLRWRNYLGGAWGRQYSTVKRRYFRNASCFPPLPRNRDEAHIRISSNCAHERRGFATKRVWGGRKLCYPVLLDSMPQRNIHGLHVGEIFELEAKSHSIGRQSFIACNQGS